MIIIADSGSTKTTWSVAERNTEIRTYNTSGINPFFLEKEEILNLLNMELTLPNKGVSSVFFYGAGCIPAKIPVILEVLERYFGTKNIEVNTDLLAAARSLCKNQPGIACILGTGSNSCYYDGKAISQNVSPLGYILGDEGSGAVLGKKLLADILKNQLPVEIIDDFFSTYSITPATILENVYQKPFPNRFLAQYAPFISKHIKNVAIANLVENSFREFINRNLLQYVAIRNVSIHFTGSIAFHFSENLQRVMDERGLCLGNITQSPMEGLINYHLCFED